MSQPTHPLPDSKPADDAPDVGTPRARAERGVPSKRVIELPPPPRTAEKGDSPHLCEAPCVPFRQMGTVPFFRAWAESPALVSFLSSFVFHLSLFLVLALVFQVPLPGPFASQLVASMGDSAAAETLVPVGKAGAVGAADVVGNPVLLAEPIEATAETIPAPTTPETAAENKQTPRRRVAESPGQTAELLSAADTDVSGMLGGRGRDARASLARTSGGTDQSEAAVERGLRWLLAHQLPSGAWRFDLQGSPCQGMCRNPGKVESTTAATALGLLPFLGAGYTHREGEYQDVVRRGIYYLASRAKKSNHGADLQEGTMYSQGLSAIALAEAFAMTGDENLREPAQKALDFIVFAQNQHGGGWRYDPGKPGDTTVTGWQLMALKSGQMAKLVVPSPTIGLVKRFLDGVQYDGGASYKYMATGSRQSHTTTAIGLLSRMYTGWGRNPAMYRGIGHLVKWGPSANDIYYNFYAAQVMHHWGGPEWDAWNRGLRDHLVRTQATAGHEAGSWHFADPHGDQAGRLYSTAMAVMTLEVYYRFLPLYGRQSLRDNW